MNKQGLLLMKGNT